MTTKQRKTTKAKTKAQGRTKRVTKAAQMRRAEAAEFEQAKAARAELQKFRELLVAYRASGGPSLAAHIDARGDIDALIVAFLQTPMLPSSEGPLVALVDRFIFCFRAAPQAHKETHEDLTERLTASVAQTADVRMSLYAAGLRWLSVYPTPAAAREAFLHETDDTKTPRYAFEARAVNFWETPPAPMTATPKRSKKA